MASTSPPTAPGITPADEGVHPFAVGLPDWQESVFYDWVDATGAHAGHCRLGVLPEEQRVWLWLYVWDGTTWWTIEHPNLPLAAFDLTTWTLALPGLRLSRTVSVPLQHNELCVEGTARAISGPRAGELAPLSITLSFTAAGPPHSMGARDEVDASGVLRSACRFEQSMGVTGTVTAGGASHDVSGWGERDHSWGSRYWVLLDWTFLALHNDALHLQCADVCFADTPITEGFALEDALRPITACDLDLDLPEDVRALPTGAVTLSIAGGRTVRGTLEAIAVAAIDLDHVYRSDLTPQPVHSVYRRALVRLRTPHHGELLGWLEWCRRPRWLVESL